MAGDLHDLQAAVAADAVVLVYHRRAGRERGQLAQDHFGIALGAAAPAFLAGSLAEELFLGDQRERAIRQQQASHVGGHGEAERAPAREKAAQSAITSTVRPCRRSMSRRTSRRPAESAVDQRAAGESREERGEFLERLRDRDCRRAAPAADRRRNSRRAASRRSVRP